MLETEELGVSILQDLHQQRQSLLHAHNTVCPSSSLIVVYLGGHGWCYKSLIFTCVAPWGG